MKTRYGLARASVIALGMFALDGFVQAADAPATSGAAPAAPGNATTSPTRVLELAAPRESWTVQASAPVEQQLTWPVFIQQVLAENLDYAAARYSVDMAVADAAAARLLPNPTLSLGANRDLTFHGKYGTGADGRPALLQQPENSQIGIDQTISLSGKRHWRIKVADDTLRAGAATLQDFLRNLKLDAASAYAQALAAQLAVDRLRAESAQLTKLETAQTQRHGAGDIGEADLTETRLEALRFRTELSKAEDDAEAARYALSTFLGRNRGNTAFTVTGSLQQTPQVAPLDPLIQTTLKTRPDLVAARYTRDAARSSVSLAKASRIPDVDVGLSYGYNSSVAPNHPTDPTPGFHQLGLNFAIPLPIFDQGQNDVRKAEAGAGQAEAQLQSAELQAETAVRTAYARYHSALQRADLFQGDISKAADSLIAARRYGYQRGASSLLELIDAERNDNQLRQDYDQALVDVAQALIDLDRASGVDQGVGY